MDRDKRVKSFPGYKAGWYNGMIAGTPETGIVTSSPSPEMRVRIPLQPPTLKQYAMTYAELIKIFEPYKDEEVSMVASKDEVYFYPVSDGNKEIVGLIAEEGEDETFRVKRVED